MNRKKLWLLVLGIAAPVFAWAASGCSTETSSGQKFQLGVVAMNRKEFDSAQRYFSQAIDSQSDEFSELGSRSRADIHLVRGACFHETGNFRQAAEDAVLALFYLRLHAQEPDADSKNLQIGSHLILANSFIIYKNFDLAMEEIDYVLQLDPNNSAATQLLDEIPIHTRQNK